MKPTYTLHKLPEGFIVTSDENLNEGNTIININNFEIVENWQGHGSTDWWRKVIAQQDQIDFSALSEEEQKKIGWFDIEMLVNQLFEKESNNILHPQYQMRLSFINGFQKAQELLSDRRFTLEHMEAAACFGMLLEQSKDDPYKLSNDEEWKGFLQSLSPTSWKAEVEMELLPQAYGHGEYCQPKLTNGKITITKIL
jgi:hypothetical protein